MVFDHAETLRVLGIARRDVAAEVRALVLWTVRRVESAHALDAPSPSRFLNARAASRDTSTLAPVVVHAM